MFQQSFSVIWQKPWRERSTWDNLISDIAVVISGDESIEAKRTDPQPGSEQLKQISGSAEGKTEVRSPKSGICWRNKMAHPVGPAREPELPGGMFVPDIQFAFFQEPEKTKRDEQTGATAESGFYDIPYPERHIYTGNITSSDPLCTQLHLEPQTCKD
ncbi:uncharacterized protein APUU_61079A [Aspergillus puulaauensis]|uniref:Uncharacterized protein n=1 Tax=Aspergillus puulaauensis TaxID=1220207 RepID=A0A7R8AR29_9EURO|nr:uncharacterized protein APUU_61079A [Aspergillus puulaauensis]BCS28031.1 hypothetical protein APUU_61079A [Aspergillus puulaauensis]